MSTMLIRLAAPLQAWGADAKFERRGTERSPTKSGIIGLVAAALGRRRNEGLEDLQALCFGVRVDREGTLVRDYHTAKNQKTAYVTHRYYLADGVFLAGLEGEDSLLETIEYALNNPIFPLFLGRRSCPPEGKLSLGIRKNIALLEALQEEPWLVSHWLRKREDTQVRLSIMIDSRENGTGGFFQRDVPLSFNQSHRQFGFRRIARPISQTIANPDSRRAVLESSTEHNPMLELEES